MVTKPQRIRLANYLYGKTETELSTISPTNFYVGLSTDVMNDSGNITNEVATSKGYSRVTVPNNKSTFSTASTEGTVYNKVQIQWPQSTETWGTIRTVFFAATADAQTALYYVTVNKEVPALSTLYFEGNASGGDVTLSVSN